MEYTYADYYKNAMAFAKSAYKIGLAYKDGVGIIGFNSPEYHFALHGTWLAGGITAGIYTTNNEEEPRFLQELHALHSLVCSLKHDTTKSPLMPQYPA